MALSGSDLDKESVVLCEECRARLEEKQSLDYQPAWPYNKVWEGLNSSWLKPPAYGAYTIGQSHPHWSKDLHDRGLVLPSPYLAEIFREGMYPFYMHMILLNEYSNPIFAFSTRPGDTSIKYYPHQNSKKRTRYEQFSHDLLNFLDMYYENLLAPLGVIYQRWKIVEETLDRQGVFVPEVIFLKDSVQTLIGALLRSLIREYVVCIRDRKITGPSPDIDMIESHMGNFCLVKQLDLVKPKQKGMFDFIKKYKNFLMSPFSGNDLDNDHYQRFIEELKPELTKIMSL